MYAGCVCAFAGAPRALVGVATYMTAEYTHARRRSCDDPCRAVLDLDSSEMLYMLLLYGV